MGEGGELPNMLNGGRGEKLLAFSDLLLFLKKELQIKY